MITAEEAALRAELIIEYHASHPEHGWELQEFPQGWFVRHRNWRDHQDLFSMVIERENGLIHYFKTTPSQQILNNYLAVRSHGHPDDRWTARALRLFRYSPSFGRKDSLGTHNESAWW